MTDTTVQRTVKDRVSTNAKTHSQLLQETVQLRDQLAERERQLADLHANLDQLVDERLAELATLQECALQIYARLDAEQIFKTVLDWAMLITSAVSGALYLVEETSQSDQDQKTLRAVAQRGYWPEIKLDEPLQWPTGQDILVHAIETGQAIQQAHICEDSAILAGPEPDRSHLAIPIRQKRQPAIGVFALESAFAEGFAAAQIDSATHLACHAALAIQNALCHQELGQRLEGSLSLHQSGQSLTSCLNLNALPEAIVYNAVKYLCAERAALYQYDSGADTWSLVAALHRDDSQAPGTHPCERALIEIAAHEQVAQFQHEPSGSVQAALPLSAERMQPPQALQLDPNPLGILFLALESGSSPATQNIETLRLYADQAAVTFQNARQIAQLERAAQRQRKRADQVASESKAPLTAIQGYARLLLQPIGGEITGQQREFLETILKNASQLEKILDKQFGY